MQGDRGESPAGQAPGQQRSHQILNPDTGETRTVTQEQWRENGKALKAEGFVRVDEDGNVVEETEAEGGESQG